MNYQLERVGGEGGTSRRGRKRGANKFLTIMNINAQSLKYKMDELRDLVKRYKPHIIGITETWGKETIGDATFHIEGITCTEMTGMTKPTNMGEELFYM